MTLFVNLIIIKPSKEVNEFPKFAIGEITDFYKTANQILWIEYKYEKMAQNIWEGPIIGMLEKLGADSLSNFQVKITPLVKFFKITDAR